MPYQVSVGSQVVEFPDSVSQEEAQKILADKFPPTGEDIANALQDPNFTPTQEQYQLFEDYNKTRQTDWLQSLLTAADTVVQTAGAAGKAALTTGAAFNPKNYVEGLAQGTAQLYGLVAQSQDPNSALFKLNNLISGTGTLENRYGQFLEARQFNKDLDAYAKGDMSIMFKPEDLNPEFVQGVAMVADPTMFVPGVGQLLGAEKVAAKAVGKAAAVAGKGVQAISKPVERISAAAGKFVTEATGISPEALRGAATTSGVLAATGVGPAIGAVGAVPLVAGAATDVGRALETAGAQMGRAPTRIGALEAVGAIPEANMRQRIIGTIGRYGGDAALRTALAGTAGTLEGAALGGVLGYLSGGEEGAASGIGSGGVAGALGSLGARGLQTLTGSEAKAARLNDLTTYVDTLTPEKKAAYQSVQERFGTDTAANLMDLESLIKGTRGDIGVEIMRGDEFQKRAGFTARGVVPDENSATPRILINVDAMPKVKGDSPIYTLGHELLHALAKTKQFQGDVTGFVETLTGAYVPNPDGTVRLVSEGQYSPAKVEQLFNDYVKQLPEDARANVISANPTASDRAVYVGEELAAEQVGRILSSQKPDAFLRGFGSTRQNFTDMLLLQEASRVWSKIGQLIERTFGITPTDSVLFPEIKNASPVIDAALRRLLKARENIDEALLNADYQKSFKIDQKAITDPVAADYAVRGGFAERLPTGEVRLLTNGELLQRETRDVTALKQIIDGLPGAKIDINGEVVGDLSPEQLDAIKGSSVSSQMKQRYEMANRGINEGRALFVEYYPATEKVQDPTSKRWRTKYASRRVTFREMLMYNLLFSKENNAYVRAIDLTQVRKSLQRSIRPDGSVGGLWGNVGEFLGELNAYLSNLDRKENAIPSRNLFGPDKAEFFGNFMNSAEKGGSEFIHSFRLDRMGQMDPSDFRAKFSESAYKKMKDRFMPAGSVGEERAWKSGDGFTILTKGNNFRLYGPEGKLLGIYDSAEQAQRKANATQTRLQPENDQLKYPTRDEVGQTAEAGNRNRALDRTQSGPEGGQVNRQVRQEGDVTSGEAQAQPSGPRFMPSDAEYLSAVESGDTAKAQELVDQAAKASGYRPNRLYHGTREQSPFFEFKKQKTAYGYFFTPDKEAAEYYAGKNGRLIEAFVKTSKPANLRNVDSFLSKVPSDFNVWLQDNFGGDVEAFKAWAESGDLYSDNVGKTQNSLMRELQGLGYDSVIFEDAKGEGGVATSYVIFDPSQIKSADPITRDDSGNIIPLSQRFQSTSPDIRYMPEASQEDISALKLLPKPRRSLESAYMDGVRTRDQDPQYYDVPDYAGYDMARTAAFDLGRAGGERPRWVMAERIGKLPEGGRSQNFAEQKMERGVSVLRIVGESQSDIGTYEMFNPGEKRYVAGWMIGYGSDGEPLLVDAVDLGPVKSVPRLQPDPSIHGAYSMSGYRILPGKTKSKFRVYTPSGSLVGVVGSVDDAQRMIEKKLK